MTNVGLYTPLKNPSTRFIVKNITKQKRVRVFQYPIMPGFTRDLLAIPGISEADIRHSLLKGEVLAKLIDKEIIVVDSDIDLLQFNDEQKQFLKNSGIMKGLEVTIDQAPTLGGGSSTIPFAFMQNVTLFGAKDGVNRIFTTPDKFVNGNFANSEFRILIRHNGKGLEENIDYIVQESGGSGTGFDTVVIISFVPNTKSRLLADYVTKV